MGVKEGYRRTEIGLIPNDWIQSTIKSVCNLINGRGFKPFEWKKEGIPIIRIQNLNGSNDYNYYQGSYDKKIEVKDGQLLFAWSGSRGTSFGPHIWKGSLGLLNYHTWKVVVNEKEINKDFFLHALKSLTKSIEDNAHGASALVHTQKWEMEGLNFSFPPTNEEQTAIADALSDTDELIQALEKIIDKKILIKQGAMQKLLRPRNKYVVKRIDEIFKITAGGDLKKDDFSVIKDNKFPFNVYSNSLANNGLYGYSSSYDYDKDCITVTARGTIGFATYRDHKFTAIGRVLILQPLQEINCFFVAEYINQKIKFANETTGVPQLTAPQISMYEVMLPSILEQTRIATILSDMDEEILVLEKKLAKYKQIKQGMMHELLTGRIRLL